MTHDENELLKQIDILNKKIETLSIQNDRLIFEEGYSEKLRNEIIETDKKEKLKRGISLNPEEKHKHLRV